MWKQFKENEYFKTLSTKKYPIEKVAYTQPMLNFRKILQKSNSYPWRKYLQKLIVLFQTFTLDKRGLIFAEH